MFVAWYFRRARFRCRFAQQRLVQLLRSGTVMTTLNHTILFEPMNVTSIFLKPFISSFAAFCVLRLSLWTTTHGANSGGGDEVVADRKED